MQMLVTPGKQDLQDRMEVRQGCLIVYKHLTPDEWADATQDNTQLIDAQGCGRGRHALRIAQSIVPLKGSPRYLALSYRYRLRVTPFPVFIARILRAVLSTGFIGSAGRSVAQSAGALSVAFWLQRVSLLRWLLITMAQPHLRLRYP